MGRSSETKTEFIHLYWIIASSAQITSDSECGYATLPVAFLIPSYEGQSQGTGMTLLKTGLALLFAILEMTIRLLLLPKRMGGRSGAYSFR